MVVKSNHVRDLAFPMSQLHHRGQPGFFYSYCNPIFTIGHLMHAMAVEGKLRSKTKTNIYRAEPDTQAWSQASLATHTSSKEGFPQIHRSGQELGLEAIAAPHSLWGPGFWREGTIAVGTVSKKLF